MAYDHNKSDDYGERKGESANEHVTPDGVNRRGFLKRASSAGAGFALLKKRVGQADPDGRIRFSNVGIRYRIEDDVEPKFVHDCAPSRWEMLDGELVFYSHYLSSDEQSQLAGGRDVVSAKGVRELPASQVTLAKQTHLPTALGDSLQAEQGVLFDSSYSMPTPRIVTAGTDVKVEAGRTTQRVTPGSEAVVELDATTVGLRQFEARPTTDGTVEGETEQGATYEQTVVEATVTPELRVQNYGETSFYTVDERLEVN